MQQRPIGDSTLTIAPLVFGGNVFGWTADEQRSFALLDRLAGASACLTSFLSGALPETPGDENSAKRASPVKIPETRGKWVTDMDGCFRGDESANQDTLRKTAFFKRIPPW